MHVIYISTEKNCRASVPQTDGWLVLAYEIIVPLFMSALHVPGKTLISPMISAALVAEESA